MSITGLHELEEHYSDQELELSPNNPEAGTRCAASGTCDMPDATSMILLNKQLPFIGTGWDIALAFLVQQRLGLLRPKK